MKVLMILAIAAVILAAATASEIYREVHTFAVTRYNATSPRLKGLRKGTRVLFLSDLHNCIYGSHNERLLQTIREEKPDLILIGGDMLVGKPNEPFDTALEFVSQLPSICPVYYANGNHEGRMKEDTDKYGDAYTDYRKALEKYGVIFLENAIEYLNLNGRVSIFYSFAWGIIAIFFINFVYPFFKKKINIVLSKIPYKVQIIATNVLLIALIADTVLSSVKYLLQ